MEPFGPAQDDLRAGTVASFVAASCGSKVTPADLFPSLAVARKERKAASLDAMKAMARAIAGLTGGKVVKRG